MADFEEEEEVPETPEDSGPRDNFVSSGNVVNYNYNLGCLVSGDPPIRCGIVVVGPVENELLVAVPGTAWNRRRDRRRIGVDTLRRTVNVEVPAGNETDRTVPDRDTAFKITLGLLKLDLEDDISYDEASVQELDLSFPVGAGGFRTPFAGSLVEVARDYFTFLTAESGGGDPQGGDPAGTSAPIEQRMDAVEDGLRSIQESLAKLTGAPRDSTGRKPKAAAKKAAAAPTLPPGLDPLVAQQALLSGVTPEALAEMSAALGMPVAAPQKAAVEVEEPTSDEEEEVTDGKGGSGAHDPLAKAVISLSKIAKEMKKDRTLRKDRGLEAILDRAESGSAKDYATATRSKAAALRSLQQLLTRDPKLIYGALERHLQEDWELASAQPGIGSTNVSARGWVEFRSRIQSFPSTIRSAWLLAGIWDCLRADRIDEARARAALGVAMLDQQSCDQGGWLLASELSLEPAPPYASFTSHTAPAAWETPRTKLIDGRWFELILSRLKDLAEFQEKKARLGSSSSSRARNEDVENKETKVKVKPGKGGKDKGGDAPPAQG